MFTYPREKFKKAWPETAVGVISIVAGILLILFSAIAVASPTNAHARAAKEGGTLHVVGAYLKPSPFTTLANAFKHSEAGKGVSIDTSFGSAAGTVEALKGGSKTADVVGLDLETDVAQLADAGVVSKSWDSGRYHGIVANSVVAFAVRKGNPQGVKTWRDIAQPNIEVVLPNPFKSNSGLWAVAAAYGAQRELGRDNQTGVQYLASLLRNVPVQDATDQLSLKRFLRGQGDVFVGSEAEIQRAIKGGAKLDLVVPKQTLTIDLPLAAAAKPSNAAAATAFLKYAWSPDGQRALATAGLRPVVHSAEPKDAFEHPAGLFSIRKIGGWSTFQSKFLTPDTGFLWKIETDLGFSTGTPASGA
jgi:sulfate/thiosulfate transport system substrate-binding protein